MKILVIEDDEDVRGSIVQTLTAAKYEVDAVGDGAEGLYRATEWTYDAIVLDVVLPGMNGRVVLEKLREQSNGTPVLMLSALGQLDDRVSGLEAGADDYLVKPYHERELLARIRSLTRRTPSIEGEVIQIGRVSIDVNENRVELDGESVNLTAHQLKIVNYLARRRGRIVSRSQLTDVVYGDYDEKESNVLEVQIYNIRRKLGKDFLISRRGLGYEISNS